MTGKAPRRVVGAGVWRQLRGVVRNPDIQIIRDLIYLVFGQFTAKVVGFVLFAWLARVLAPRDYGALETLLAITAFAALVVDFGLGPAAVRHRALNGPGGDAVIAVVPALRIGLALAAMAGVCLAVFAVTEDTATRTLGGLLALALLLQAWKQEWLLQSLEMMRLVALGQFLRMAVLAVLAIALIRHPGDLLWFGVAEIVSFAVVALFYMRIQIRAGYPPRLSLARATAGPLLRQAFPLGLNAMVWGVIQYLPTLLVGAIAGLEQAAYLAAAQRLTTSLQSLSYVYHFNLYPALSRRHAEGVAALQKLSLASLRVVAWATIGPAAICAANAGGLLGLIYGPAYAPATPVLAILIFIVPVQLLSGHHRWALTAAGETRSVLTAGLAGAAVSTFGTLALVGLVPAGVPGVAVGGAVGGAIAALAAGLAIWAVSMAACRRQGLPLPVLARIWRPAASAALAVLPGLLAPPLLASGLPLYAALSLGAAIYAALALIVDRRAIYRDLRHLAYTKQAAQ